MGESFPNAQGQTLNVPFATFTFKMTIYGRLLYRSLGKFLRISRKLFLLIFGLHMSPYVGIRISCVYRSRRNQEQVELKSTQMLPCC